jgi:hypothetical protein
MASGDPYWLNARFTSKCSCGASIRKGDRIFYYPKSKKALCTSCGERESAKFDAARFDEDNNCCM